MSILQQTNIPPSKEELLSEKIREIKHLSKSGYTLITHLQNQGINLLWNDINLTPQEICDALGEDAVKVFEIHGILTNAINQIAAADGIAPDIHLPTNAFEVVNGAIVVSEDPYTV